jgi:CelD/BcsL family acetyltransferase involved in cellulose biosynthesis
VLQSAQWKQGLQGHVLDRHTMRALQPSWTALSKRCIEDNVYYAPRYAGALLDTVEAQADLRFATVWDGAELLALLPFTLSALPLLHRAGRAWQSKYTYSCTPLLDAARAAEAADALVALLAEIHAGAWFIPAVNTEGAAARAFLSALQRKQHPWCFSAPMLRPMLERLGSFDEHMKRHVSTKRRKELARTHKRLAQLGRVEHAVHTAGAQLEWAVGAFLAIEARGWKGRRQTALACRPETRAFALQAFTGDAASSICRADVLTLNSVPIAVSLIVFSGETGFTVKCAYDESYRNYGPGLILEQEVIRSFLSGSWAARLDAATAGAHVIDGLWPGRTAVADLLFSAAPRHAALHLAAVQTADRIARRARATVKQLVSQIRARAALNRRAAARRADGG